MSTIALITVHLSVVLCLHGNNPFRINNIVNGTNYTISVSLRNDFGQSGESTPELYGEGKTVSIMDIHVTVYIVYVYDFYLVRL